MDRPPLPPFTLETATEKVRLAEDGWNTRDPQRVALAAGARLPLDQGNLGLSGEPNCRALRVARRQRAVVPQLR